MQHTMTLSKSDYMTYLKHPAWLWLKKFGKHQLLEISEDTQALFEAGHEFERYAERLYPGGVMLGFDNFDEYDTLVQRTQKALDDGVNTIFQGRFESNNLTCIVDVLDRVDGDTFDLIEIKSSTHAKPEHYYDLAFQVKILESCGLSIRTISVLHINKFYRRHGEINPRGITMMTDVTNEVRALAEVTNIQIEKAMQVLSLKQMPDPSPRWANQLNVPGTQWFYEWLGMYKHLHPKLDPYSIYSLSYPNARQIGELEDAGILLIRDIPDTNLYKEKHQFQIKVTKSGERILDIDNIKAFLDTFVYPLHFLDYETYCAAIPIFENESPYTDYPFQYSLHIFDSPDGEVRHAAYLHQENTPPIPYLIEKLQKDIGTNGTILTWNMGYEKGCNDCMARVYPQYEGFLSTLNDRINDLMIPFSNLWFVDKDFFGSASLKNVLPVLVPELNYKELDVSDGLTARRLWMDTFLNNPNDDNKEYVLRCLNKYCTLDTYAMVRIFQELRKVAGGMTHQPTKPS